MKIGYIRRDRFPDGTEKFTYIEGNATRRIGARTDTVKVKFLYGAIPYEEITIDFLDIEGRKNEFKYE